MALGKDLIKELYAPQNRTYDGIRKILAQINSKIYDSSKTVVFNQKTESAFANIRKKLNSAEGSPVHHKSEYLGICVRSDLSSTPPVVYVDIPTYDIEGVVHYDQFWDPSNKLRTLEHKAFYPQSIPSFRQSPPREGHIVRVRVAPNYFGQDITNPHDNTYIGVFDDNIFVTPTTISEIVTAAKIKLGLTKQAEEKASAEVQAPKGKIEVEKIIMDNLIGSLDLSVEQAAGIVGNLYQESQLNYKAINPTSKAYGIAQWLGARKAELINFAGIKGGRIDDVNLQAEFLVHEFQTTQKAALAGGIAIPFIGGRLERSRKEYVQGIRKAKTIEEATVSCRRLFERPGEEEANDSRRVKYALSVYKNYTQPQQLSQSQSKQPVPKADSVSNKKDKKATPSSDPTGRPKLKIVDFLTDMPNGVKVNRHMGGQKIKVREDIVASLQSIKGTLNTYGIPFNCEYIDVRLENSDISLLARVGLQVNLNFWTALSPDMNINTDDYLVGPDYSRPVGEGWGLKVYGKCNKISTDMDFMTDVIYEPVDIYNVRATINTGEPTVTKTSSPLIDITRLFEEKGFVHALPKKSFFKFSDVTNSNWNIFQIPSKISSGYTYKELLLTVYDLDNSPIWNSDTKTWNGSRFV
jgi:hypothetical protein